jgi:hypothetical protein
LSSNVNIICNGTATAATLTANEATVGSGAVYEWGTGLTPGENSLSPSTTTGNTYSVTPNAATTYWVRLKGTTGACSTTVTGGATTAIAVYPAIEPGAINTASTTTNVNTNPNQTIENTTEASGGSGSSNLTYVWVRTGTSSATLTGNEASYDLNTDADNYSTADTYYFNRYAKDAACTGIAPVAAVGTYTLYVENAGPPGTASTLCTQCCYDGSAWVDCYVSGAVSTSAQWIGNSNQTYFQGASGNGSDKDGRKNFNAITAIASNYTANSAVGLCKAVGGGWYLPAYEELYAMSSGSANSAYSNGRDGAKILTSGYHWSSAEYYSATTRGRISSSDTGYQAYAVVYYTGGLLNNYKTGNFYVRCAWRN